MSCKRINRSPRSPTMFIIQLSQAAIQEIQRLGTKQSRSEASQSFRLSTAAKGCSSRSYVMEFDNSTQTGDQVVPLSEKLQLVVNARELSYLAELTIDYSEDMMGGGFRFHNPNATQVCSCGNSFMIGK
ncbi:MAG: iron-sulfur cluster assembly accessory protein [Leptolyngbyaceae cyanobacterium bins.302]|nr:iron-sulfur cluster assembly accessory protein [Leptolyngbyaceae cyanobacterium bins.302]